MGSLPWPVKELEGPLQVSDRPHLTLPSVPGTHQQAPHRTPAGLMRRPNCEPEGTLQVHDYPASEHGTQQLAPVPRIPQPPISGPAGFSEPLKDWSKEQNPGGLQMVAGLRLPTCAHEEGTIPRQGCRASRGGGNRGNGETRGAPGNSTSTHQPRSPGQVSAPQMPSAWPSPDMLAGPRLPNLPP